MTPTDTALEALWEHASPACRERLARTVLAPADATVEVADQITAYLLRHGRWENCSDIRQEPGGSIA